MVPGGGSVKVLVIDDEVDICHIIQMALKARGHEVRFSTSGEEGITLFFSLLPDILFLDMTLPDKNGIEVARAIKNSDHGKTVPIVLMSGMSPSMSHNDAALFAAVLGKPFSISALEPLLKKLTDKP